MTGSRSNGKPLFATARYALRMRVWLVRDWFEQRITFVRWMVALRIEAFAIEAMWDSRRSSWAIELVGPPRRAALRWSITQRFLSSWLPRPGRYEQNDSQLIAEWLDTHSEYAERDAGDSEVFGHLSLFGLAPWQRDSDPRRYGLWTSSQGARNVDVFESRALGIEACEELDLETFTPRCELCEQPQDQSWENDGDWNGDTGNHLSCEAARYSTQEDS